MRNVKGNKRRWKQLMALLIVAVMLFTTPHIVGLASSMGSEEAATTQSVDQAGAAVQSEEEKAGEVATTEAAQEESQTRSAGESKKEDEPEKASESQTEEAAKEKATTEKKEDATTSVRKNKEQKETTKSETKTDSEVKTNSEESQPKQEKQSESPKTYIYKGDKATIKVEVNEDGRDFSSLRFNVKQVSLNNKIRQNLENRTVGEDDSDCISSIRTYSISFVKNGKSMQVSADMKISFSDLNINEKQNAVVYRIDEDNRIKNTNAVLQDGTMTFAEESLVRYAIVTYNKIEDINGNEITAAYPAMIQAAEQEASKTEDGNIPITSWERSETALSIENKKSVLTNWKWSDVAGIDLNLNRTDQIWNGSRTSHASNKYIKSGQVTAKSGILYDSAIWRGQNADDKKASVNRIRGEFKITAKNKDRYSYTLKPVTGSENIYTKDNTFVFVYPKDVKLTDDNYMNYLAFWTGADAQIKKKEVTFHGRSASNYTQRQPVENISKLTDGWYTEAVTDNVGHIITSSDEQEFYVDIFTECTTDASGIYRMQLEQKKADKTTFTFRNLDTESKTGKAGAKFELYKNGVYYTAESAEDGTVNFDIITPSDSDTDVYTLRETEAPEGYDRNTTTWHVLVNQEGVASVKDTSNMEMAKYPDGIYVMSSSKANAEPETSTRESTTQPVEKHYKSNDVNVTVTAENGADIPEGAELVVKPVELTAKAEENVEQAAVKEGKRAVKKLHAYDIHFELDGKEVQPGDSVKVSVDVPEITAGRNAMVYHVDDNNKVENMDGSVDKKGEVVFETTHFSTYVIVNQGSSNITVTIEHYKADSYNSTTRKYEKIYSNDIKTIAAGNSIENYAKAANWNVASVKVNGSTVRDVKLTLTNDATVEVYYTAKPGTMDGQTTFYDYTVQAGTDKNGKYQSINVGENYPSGSLKTKRLSVGETKRNYTDYQYTCTVNSKNANAWTGNPSSKQDVSLVTGLLGGLNTDGSPKFNYDEPGFFKNEDKSFQDRSGKTIYTRKVINDYTLSFSRSGDTYSLSSVKNGTGTQVATGGDHFFPLDGVDHSAEQEKTNPHTGDYGNGCTSASSHNYYFGMRYDVNFTLGDYIGPLNYSFTGDDDLWVLLDGEVVLDIGGIHNKCSGSVDLWNTILGTGYTDTDKENLSSAQKEQVHTVTVLYMERGAAESNCTMNFTLPSAHIVEVTKPKQTFTIHKQSTDGKSLKGAEFTLTKGNTTITKITEADGYATFTELEPGTYTLKETKAPKGYEAPVDSEDKAVEWTVTVNADGTVVVKDKNNTEIAKDVWGNYIVVNTKESQLPAPDHQKYIKKESDNKYKLTLDVTGKVGNADPIDILLIVDKSGSMEGSNASNVNTAISKLVQTLKDANIRTDVNLAVVTFSGSQTNYDRYYPDRGYDTIGWNDAATEQNWTSLKNFSYTLTNCDGGTNWQAGIKEGEKLLKTGTGSKKYVVFLTDGDPTYRYDQSTGYTVGNGSSDPNGSNYQAAITEWSKSPTLGSAEGKYVIDATQNGSNNCKSLAQAISGTRLMGNNEAHIQTSFETIAKQIAYPSYNNVKITDTLSEYAQFVTFDKNNNNRPVITVHKGVKTLKKDQSGNVTGIESVTSEKTLAESTDYTYTYNASTKTIEVTFLSKLEENKTYWIEFDITPTEKAYKDYLTNGGYSGTKGDALTDAPGNTTSSGKDGFYSNDTAKVSYKVDQGKGKDADYDKPVIQVKTDTTSQKVIKQWIGTKKESVTVKLAAKATVGGNELSLSHDSYKSLPETMSVELNKDNKWTYTWDKLPTKYYYLDEDDTVKSADITYSLDETSVPDGYVKSVTTSTDGKTTTITNREVVIEKIWTDKQVDSRPEGEAELHPEGQNIYIGIYKPGTDGSEGKEFSNANLVSNVTLNKANNWKATLPVACGEDYDSYVIRELKKDVNGFTVIDEQSNITVDYASYKVSYSTTDSADEVCRYTVTNTRLNSITINKIDSNNEPLGGAAFIIEKKVGEGWEQVGAEQTTPEDGELKGSIKFTDLEDGKYRIIEVKSPNGHSLLANPIEVTLPLTADSSQEGLEKGKGITKEDGKIYYYDLTYTIKNNKLFDMPEAGGGFRATFIGIAVMIIAGGWYLLRKRRRIV